MIDVIRSEMCDETKIDIIPITIYLLVLLFTPQEREKKGKKKERKSSMDDNFLVQHAMVCNVTFSHK